MKLEVPRVQSAFMALSDQYSRLYLSAHRVRTMAFPEMGASRPFGKVGNSRLILSPEGRHIALLTDSCRMEIYDVLDAETPLFARRSKNATGLTQPDSAFFLDEKHFYYTSFHTIQMVDLSDEPQIKTVYGDPKTLRKKSEILDRYGMIFSMSCHGEEIAFIASCSDYRMRKAVLINLRGEVLKEQQLTMEGAFEYWWIRFTGAGEVYLFPTKKDLPVLYYHEFPNDFSRPDRQFSLPETKNPVFSSDGKYCSTSVSRRTAYLYRTDDWSVQETVAGENEEDAIYYTSFSSENKYWLVGGEKGRIISL